jgi:sec-independent protein translocase protein TatA
MQIGTAEIVVLVIVMAIVFSASRMSALGNALGKFIHSFKKASQGDGFVEGKVEKRLTRTGPIEDAEVVQDAPDKRGPS